MYHVLVVIGLLFQLNHVIDAKAYNAVVMDHSPKIKPQSFKDVMQNVADYEVIIDEHKGNDIIVFPEYGLTAMHILERSTKFIHETFAFLIPNPDPTIDICVKSATLEDMRSISAIACAAKRNNIYVVINLLERGNNSDIVYNSNIVFNRNGSLISRYRKINLYGTENIKLKAGTKVVTFKTDFGVKFGMFICFDILFENPALDVLKNKITNVIFNTAWISQVPYLTALQVQHGYFRSTGVNLLASGLAEVAGGSGGSGIYTAHNGKSVIFMPSVDGQKSIRAKVHHISRKKRDPCDKLSGPITELEPSRNFSNFSLRNDFKERFDIFVFKQFKNDKENHTLCSKKYPDFCCEFGVDLIRTKNPTPVYMSSIAAISKTSGSCGITACESEDPKTCGKRTIYANNVIFKHMSVKATNLKSNYIFPSTLSYDLIPLTNYSYCKRKNIISVLSNSDTSGVITFGFYSSLLD